MSNQMGKTNIYLSTTIIPQNIWEKYLYFRCNKYKKGKAKSLSKSLSNFHNTGQKLINNSIFFMISKKMFQFEK